MWYGLLRRSFACSKPVVHTSVHTEWRVARRLELAKRLAPSTHGSRGRRVGRLRRATQATAGLGSRACPVPATESLR